MAVMDGLAPVPVIRVFMPDAMPVIQSGPVLTVGPLLRAITVAEMKYDGLPVV